jgi:hypothetical protein
MCVDAPRWAARKMPSDFRGLARRTLSAGVPAGIENTSLWAHCQIEVPVLDQVRSSLTILQPLPVIGLQLDVPLPSDVRQVLAHSSQ